jgi:hypothetical protein
LRRATPEIARDEPNVEIARFWREIAALAAAHLNYSDELRSLPE